MENHTGVQNVEQKSGKVRSLFQKKLTPYEIEQVRWLAYEAFVKRGYEHGYDQDDWKEAERLVRSRRRA